MLGTVSASVQNQCFLAIRWFSGDWWGLFFCLSRGVPAVPATSLQSPPLAPAEAFTGGTWCHEFKWWLAWCFAASGHQQTDDDIRAYFAAVADLESRWLTITSWVNVAQKHVLYRFVVCLPLRQFSGFNGVMWQVGLCQRALWSQC